ARAGGAGVRRSWQRPDPKRACSRRRYPAVMATPRRPMSDEHKAALSEGRSESRAVRSYLEALDQHRPRRRRRRTRESVEKRLAAVEAELTGASALQRLRLV